MGSLILRAGCFALIAAAVAADAQMPADSSESGARPQLIPRTKAEREERYASLHRVLLNVQVTDASGHAVPGLSQQDFTLRIAHQPQKITMFRAIEDSAKAKAHAFLVIDTLNNSARELAFTRKEIEKYVRSLKGPLPVPVALAIMGEGGLLIERSTRDGEELLTLLAQFTHDAHPTNCTEDWNNAAMGLKTTLMSPDDPAAHNKVETGNRIAECLNHKFQLSLVSLRDFALQQRDVPGRAIMIWIGPGWPVLSGPEFEPDTPQVRANDFSNLVDMERALREAQVTLDGISWMTNSRVARLDPADWETLMRGTPTSSQASSRSLAMPVLAHLTGGRVYFNQKSLAEDIAACLADAESYYLLGFDSAPSEAADELRPIEVTVDQPGMVTRSIAAYYAQP